MREIFGKIIAALLIFLSVVGCQKKEEVGVNPYEGGKEPFGILFTANRTDPEIAAPGEVVRVNVKGLKKYENKFDIRLNDVSTEVVALTDSTIDIRMPTQVSSGIVTVILDGQIFYGPRIGVEGKVAVDTDYKIVNGFDMGLRQIMPHSGGHIVVGSFTNFENEKSGNTYRTGIHHITSLGQSSTSMDFRRRANGPISSIARLPNGKFIVGGSLTTFSARAVGGIARLNANGSLDTTVVAVINPNADTKPLDGLDTVSSFNAGFSGGMVSYVFETPDNGVIVVGSFTSYWKIDYTYSSRVNRYYINTKVKNVARLKEDGTLDSTFNVNNTGFNGFVNGAVKLNDGRIVIAGTFTNYNGKAVNNIVCLKPNGEVDEDFLSHGGTNLPIQSVTYNSTLNKLAIAGTFKTFGSVPTNGVVLLNADGSVDQNFVLGDMDGEFPNYAYILNSGKVFVTGSFSKYNGINRGGVLILEADGTAKQEYNNLGSFRGTPTTLVETTSSLGNPAILLGGTIYEVGGKNVGHIVKIEIKN